MMPDEVHMMRKEIYDSEGYTQRTSMPVWQARCAAQQPTRREHGLRANPVLRARTVALPFLFVRLCYRRLWPSSSTRRRGMCKSRYGPAVPVRAARRAMGGPALITCSFPLRNKRIKLRYYVRSPPHRSAPSRPRAPPVPSAECDRVASSRPRNGPPQHQHNGFTEFINKNGFIGFIKTNSFTEFINKGR